MVAAATERHVTLHSASDILEGARRRRAPFRYVWRLHHFLSLVIKGSNQAMELTATR